MIIDVVMQITPQSLQLFVPQAGHNQERLNLIALNPKTRRIFGFGESQEQVRQRLGERWKELEGDLIFKPALGLDDPNPELDKYVLWRFLSESHQQVRDSRGFMRFVYQVLDRFDVRLEIEGYERFSVERRQALEFFLQSDLRARKVTVNGKAVEIPPGLRNLESFLRVAFTLTIPYLLIGVGVFLGLSLPERSLPGGSTLLVVGVIILSGVLLEMLGKAAWMIVMRRLVPVSYLRYFLPRLPMRGLTRWLADILLQD